MKTVVILSISIIFVWFLITRFESGNGTVILDTEAIKQIHRKLIILKILWLIMIALQTILSIKLYKLIPKMQGSSKRAIIFYFGLVFITLIFSFIIFFIGESSFWL
jgi:hypothetical protein